MSPRRKILLAVLFGVSFGLLEAIVVIYIRTIMGAGNMPLPRPITPDDIALSLGFIAFLKPAASDLLMNNPRISSLELWRELSTIATLVCFALIAGRSNKQKLGYFLLAFGIWDIFYYVFLKLISGWPRGFLDTDIYFLIPVAWVGPVITPLIISTLLVIAAISLIGKKQAD